MAYLFGIKQENSLLPILIFCDKIIYVKINIKKEGSGKLNTRSFYLSEKYKN